VTTTKRQSGPGFLDRAGTAPGRRGRLRRVASAVWRGSRSVRPLLLATAVAGVFGWLLHVNHRRFESSIVDRVRASRRAEAAALAHTAEAAFDHLVQALRLVAASPALRASPAAPCESARMLWQEHGGWIDRLLLGRREAGHVRWTTLAGPGHDGGGTPSCAALASRPAGSAPGSEVRAGTEAREPKAGSPSEMPAEVRELKLPLFCKQPRFVQGASAEAIWILVPAPASAASEPLRRQGGSKMRSAAPAARPVGEAPARSAVACRACVPALMERVLREHRPVDKSFCWVVGASGRTLARWGPAIGRISGGDDGLSDVIAACVKDGRSGTAEVRLPSDRRGGSLLAYAPAVIGAGRLGVIVGGSMSDVSVPLASHERVTYALIFGLSVLYFATGFVCYRSERAHRQLSESRRQAAEAANRAKSDFLARVSHEIRTPMNGILGMAEMALDDEPTEPQRKCLRLIQQSGHSLLAIINDLLDLSRIEAGKLRISAEPFDLPDCLDDTLRPLRRQAARQNVGLDLEVDPSVPARVVGDPGRLRQIITNLVSNALRFTERGRVAVRVRPARPNDAGVTLQFEVADTGPGIPRDKQQRIFEAFEQADTSDRRERGGTGLGLAICAQLVELMGGTIGLESTPGVGSTFRFTAPFPEPPASPESNAGAMPPGMRVLVIDGDAAEAARTSEAASACGCQVDTAATAAEGLQAARRRAQAGGPYEVVFVDAVLPDADGFHVASQLREQHDPRPPAIVLTAPLGLRGDGARCRDLGVRAYLPKPVTAEMVREALAQAAGPSAPALVTRHSLRQRVRRLHVLLAEDDEVNREYASMVLRKAGHAVTCVADGAAAVQRCGREAFDVVLMDMRMPRMDGVTAAAEIRRHERPGTHVPILAMTANAMAEARAECLEAGMDGYVSKPVTASGLLEAIDAARAAGAEAPWPGAGDNPTDAPNDGAPSAEPARPAEGCADDAAGTAPGAQVPWDRAAALQGMDGDAEMLWRLVGSFLRDWPEQAEALRQVAEAGDLSALRRLGHKLRGTLALLGAPRATRQAQAMEDAAVREAAAEAAAAARRLADEVERFRQAAGQTNAQVQEETPCES